MGPAILITRTATPAMIAAAGDKKNQRNANATPVVLLSGAAPASPLKETKADLRRAGHPVSGPVRHRPAPQSASNNWWTPLARNARFEASGSQPAQTDNRPGFGQENDDGK
jgi:hypothetical protein